MSFRLLIIAYFYILASACTDYVTTAGVNLRKGPGTSYPVVSSAVKGTTLCVESITSGWAKISDGSYCAAQYLTKVEPSTCTNYIATSALNIRSGAGTEFKIVRTAAKGSTLCVVSISSGWAKLSDGNFCSAQYLTKAEPSTCTNYYVTASSLNIRSSPSSSSSIVTTAKEGQILCVVSISNGWAKLSDGNYCSSQFITKDAPDDGGDEEVCSGGETAPCTTITKSQMKKIFPSLPSSKAAEYAGYLDAAFVESAINTKLRIVHFLAQVGHESGGLIYFEEIASGEEYEGRIDLGNTQPGDGKRFKGRGPIQITGRSNYKACGDYLGLDLINNPTWLAQPKIGFRGAAWFWKANDLNKWADKDDILTITKRVNGGTNGLADRQAYLAKAKAAYGI